MKPPWPKPSPLCKDNREVFGRPLQGRDNRCGPAWATTLPAGKQASAVGVAPLVGAAGGGRSLREKAPRAPRSPQGGEVVPCHRPNAPRRSALHGARNYQRAIGRYRDFFAASLRGLRPRPVPYGTGPRKRPEVVRAGVRRWEAGQGLRVRGRVDRLTRLFSGAHCFGSARPALPTPGPQLAP